MVYSLTRPSITNRRTLIDREPEANVSDVLTICHGPRMIVCGLGAAKLPDTPAIRNTAGSSRPRQDIGAHYKDWKARKGLELPDGTCDSFHLNWGKIWQRSHLSTTQLWFCDRILDGN